MSSLRLTVPQRLLVQHLKRGQTVRWAGSLKPRAYTFVRSSGFTHEKTVTREVRALLRKGLVQFDDGWRANDVLLTPAGKEVVV